MINMQNNRLKYIFIFILGLIIFSKTQISAEPRLNIFVSIVPQKYFVEKIGKSRVNVNVMVKPGASPATYEPKPRQMVVLSKTRLYFAIGVAFEQSWLKRIASANPNMEIIHTDEGIRKIAMESHLDHEDEHDETPDDHSENHKGLDPHIWLSPSLVMVQAKKILDGLQKIDPTHQNEYDRNYQSFMAEIENLDHSLKSTFADQNDLQFIVFHPSWGYFARDYKLQQIPIEIEGKNPKPAQLKELIKQARKNHIQIIFVQPQFSTRSAKLVARAIRGEVVFADPLAENWMKNLRAVAEKFKKAIK